MRGELTDRVDGRGNLPIGLMGGVIYGSISLEGMLTDREDGRGTDRSG